MVEMAEAVRRTENHQNYLRTAGEGFQKIQGAFAESVALRGKRTHPVQAHDDQFFFA